ncbi:MAG: Uncharacterized protein JWR37_2993 [Mycobacterium sp.]|jgi:hypothetical protein|nr:Uncharacterized protein [Mycobacterium sp.]
MRQRIAVAVAAMVVAATALLSAPACAHAAPPAEPVVPQVDGPCSEKLADALTKLPDGKTVLECLSPSGGYQWKPFASPYPNSDRWLSYGPGLRLHGQGKRNPEIMSGQWVGSPLDPSSQCSVEQVAVVSAGKVGPPQLSTGKPGQPFEFEVLPVVFDITLTGNCLWQKAA